ncbi:hypothetical protein [Kitasatospora sp. LaBMicrA B282]|uniref:hypothetical protein n=1 Tax=Kitasatospora sp. LaBMicrA B282 TaxID=3420949 RepID=UPI003D117B02
MAIRRAKQKAQVIEKLSQVAPPGETFIACVHVETGPSPWLNAIFDEIPGLGLIVALTRRFYFLTLTSSSVVVNTASRWTNRPGEVVGVFPRHAFPVTRVKRATVWSSMYLIFPGETKPTRLNIHRYWRNEMDQLSAVFPPAAMADGSLPQAMTGQLPPADLTPLAPQGQPYPQGAPQPFPQQAAPAQPYPGQPMPPAPPQYAQQPPAQAYQQPAPAQPYPGQPMPPQGGPQPVPHQAPPAANPYGGPNPYGGQAGQTPPPNYTAHPDQY